MASKKRAARQRNKRVKKFLETLSNSQHLTDPSALTHRDGGRERGSLAEKSKIYPDVLYPDRSYPRLEKQSQREYPFEREYSGISQRQYPGGAERHYSGVRTGDFERLYVGRHYPVHRGYPDPASLPKKEATLKLSAKRTKKKPKQ